MTDPFLHEARVHLFSRDVNLERARKAEADDKPRLFAAAYGENRILEAYFGELLRASSYAWPAELEAEVRASAHTDEAFESKSGRSLVTAYSQQQVFWVFLSLVVGLLLLGRYFGRRARG